MSNFQKKCYVTLETIGPMAVLLFLKMKNVEADYLGMRESSVCTEKLLVTLVVLSKIPFLEHP